MANVVVSVADRPYTMQCPDGEEDHLRELASLLDAEIVRIKQSVGLGLRVLFPEFDRIVLRADWGFPLSPGYSSFPGAFFLSFGQAFALPTVSVPSVLTETL